MPSMSSAISWSKYHGEGRLSNARVSERAAAAEMRPSTSIDVHDLVSRPSQDLQDDLCSHVAARRDGDILEIVQDRYQLLRLGRLSSARAHLARDAFSHVCLGDVSRQRIPQAVLAEQSPIASVCRIRACFCQALQEGRIGRCAGHALEEGCGDASSQSDEVDPARPLSTKRDGPG